MNTTTGKRTAKVKLTLTKRTVETLQPADKPWIAWDDRLSGFGVRVQPSGTKAFIINYRTGKRRTEGAQPAHRHRPLRPPGPRGGAPPRPGAAGTRRPGRGSRSGAGRQSRHADPPGGVRGVPDGEPQPQEQHRNALPEPDALLPRRLAGAAPGHDHAPGGGGALPSRWTTDHPATGRPSRAPSCHQAERRLESPIWWRSSGPCARSPISAGRPTMNTNPHFSTSGALAESQKAPRGR